MEADVNDLHMHSLRRQSPTVFGPFHVVVCRRLSYDYLSGILEATGGPGRTLCLL
jgi:hypothetical protein